LKVTAGGDITPSPEVAPRVAPDGDALLKAPLGTSSKDPWAHQRAAGVRNHPPRQQEAQRSAARARSGSAFARRRQLRSRP